MKGTLFTKCRGKKKHDDKDGERNDVIYKVKIL